MANIAGVLEIVLPVFLALCLGMLCRAKRILSPEGNAALKKVAVSITLPAVSFGTFARADYSAGRMLVPVWMFFRWNHHRRTILCLVPRIVLLLHILHGPQRKHVFD